MTSLHVMTLRIDLAGYWHAGSGRGSGSHLDALCERNADGLPVLPGRQLKGLLRHAVRRAEAWGWYADLPLPAGPASNIEILLFGSDSQTEDRHGTLPGLLAVDSAELPAAERNWLAAPVQASWRSQLFDELFSTAIDENGTARDHSLRGVEVALPTVLEAGVSLQAFALEPAHRRQQDAWLAGPAPWSALAMALPLVDAIGAHRSRGLGEACLTLTSSGGAHA